MTEHGNMHFTTSNEQISELLKQVGVIADLGSMAALADWDQQTGMPEGASEVRAHQMATLQGLIHERVTDPRGGELLAALEDVVKQQEYTDADRGLVYQARRSYDQATKLPRDMVEEMERVRVKSFDAWVKARQHNDFASFSPWLQRTVEFQREIADRFGYKECRYDALLDLYEPELTASRVDVLFAPVREVSASVLKRIQESGKKVDTSILSQSFPIEKQQEVNKRLLEGMGYDFNRGQIAVSAHPFTTSFGSPLDVRLTTRYDEKNLPWSIMSSLHEGGHAVYEQGCAPSLLRTPLANGASMGVHESQSRLWENAIGRSEAFWRGQFPALQSAFPEQFQGVDATTFAYALNNVEPSLIRTEADEVTYNLHIIIRFEIERALINGDIAVESLPSLWNAKYKEYLGVVPPTDSLGVLQDVHWASGFGYFPSYTLGNLYGAQIYSTLRSKFPDFDARLEQGDTRFALTWLQEHMYVYGAAFKPANLLKRIVGEEADPGYFVRYLTEKFSKIYDL
ncbi:carboxypeptidase M32 [Ktedonospora formicarum]|uniref:Metal-dependent carboxypeptidase n=1 Tax=Ktedonospora formicarum TaxID=2778364 RepID=A0A8J3HW52_9CHLR|nr:carboxypeptidase M32 [Ktedonospora formicarum]GHO44331.1 carboxypeptidase M32 [Ktedonospora formicarum]